MSNAGFFGPIESTKLAAFDLAIPDRALAKIIISTILVPYYSTIQRTSVRQSLSPQSYHHGHISASLLHRLDEA